MHNNIRLSQIDIMPVNLSNVICGGAKDIGGSYLANPIYTAIIIVIIVFIILIWRYWGQCAVVSHLTTIIYIFAAVTVTLICHNEVISAQYESKYKNKAVEELTDTIVNRREQEILSALSGRPTVTPQLTQTAPPAQPAQQLTQPQQPTAPPV